jgi:glycine dehydrogenase
MITYPSTHGVFAGIRDICDIVHAHGGQVYLDSANMNAQVDLARPGVTAPMSLISICTQDVLHPAWQQRSGMGPIGVRRIWHRICRAIPQPTAARAYGRPGVGGAVRLGLDPHHLLHLHSDDGRRRTSRATEVAILNANYIAARLQLHFRCCTGTEKAASRTNASSTRGLW